MKFSLALVAIAAATSISAFPVSRRGVNVRLVPPFGHTAGLNPTGTGDCDGITNPAGVVVKIPCNCPPPKDVFLAALNANVAAGHAVNNPAVSLSFPEDDSPASELARVTATLVTLQNLRGPGIGCPAASTTLLAKQKFLAEHLRRRSEEAELESRQVSSEEEEEETCPTETPAEEEEDYSTCGVESQPLPDETTDALPIATATEVPSATSAPISPPTQTNPLQARGVDLALIPALGHQAGLNPTGTGDCDGIPDATGKAIKIPCICPPSRADFLQSLNANVAVGFAVNNPSILVTFPTGDSKADKLARIQAAVDTLQNLRGASVGCPIVSTTLAAQREAIAAGTDGPATAPPVLATPDNQEQAPPVPAPGASIVNEADIPEFGHAAGLNPTGTGDCDGITNAAGVAIKVPCSCPPDRPKFIESLRANVAAGQAVNNPNVKISFPEGTSKEAKLARMHAALVTLQNLNGSGVGCPAASTTFVQQQQAIERGP